MSYQLFGHLTDFTFHLNGYLADFTIHLTGYLTDLTIHLTGRITDITNRLTGYLTDLTIRLTGYLFDGYRHTMSYYSFRHDFRPKFFNRIKNHLVLVTVHAVLKPVKSGSRPEPRESDALTCFSRLSQNLPFGCR
ncbi:MAG: hypothetical protein LBT86_05245, partial [Deltaproteobacteria bacterium]|nr:hypothetical protein [Deltaproteobacteria bacterium]